MKISVKVGSNQLVMSVSKQATCADLIRMALLQCKIGKPVMQKRFFLFKSSSKIELNDSILANYGLFERAIGIERQIDNHENISQLWLKWNSSGQHQMQFIIKHLSFSSNQLSQRRIQVCQNSQRIFKHYKKQLRSTQRNHEIDSHEYESIDQSISYRQLVNKSPAASSDSSSITSSTSSDLKPLIEL